MKKNLLYIFADQWRRTAIGYASEEPVLTPNMDDFAQKSVYCQNAISACPLCSPHRASLLTGKYPLSTGVFTNCKTGLSMKLSDDELTLGELLKQEGYETAYIGKWHLDNPEMNHTDTPESGARDWDAYTPPGPGRHGFDYWYSYGTHDEHLQPHYWADGPEMIQIEQWSPEHETDKAIEFLSNQTAKKPFGMVISWNPPHSPYEKVPDKYLDLYKNRDIPLRPNVDAAHLMSHTGEEMNFTKEELIDKTKQYYAAISGLDEQFGRLIAALKKQDLLENTCIVLSADHGDMMGSHGLMAKHVWYEESIGIPFIAGGPDLTPGRCNTVIGGVDILPTLLEWLAIGIPKSIEGTSRFKAMQDHAKKDDSIAYSSACPGRDIFLAEFKSAGKDPRDFGWRAARTQQYIYVVDVGYAPKPYLHRYLYNLNKDPYQCSPIRDDALMQNKKAMELEESLKKHLEKYKDGFLRHLQ